MNDGPAYLSVKVNFDNSDYDNVCDTFGGGFERLPAGGRWETCSLTGRDGISTSSTAAKPSGVSVSWANAAWPST
ncbi:hypothetical protein [Streptomyces formicae]